MPYKPRSGDIIWLDFDPQAGHEQKGHRPALIVWGNDTLDLMPNMVQVCAISNTDNKFPLHISLQGETENTAGFVLCEQNKVVDLKARNAEYKDKISDELLLKIKNILKAMLD